MPMCQAFGCVNRPSATSGKRFFAIPDPKKDPERCKKWLHAIGTDKFTFSTYSFNKNRLVCEDHFEESCFVRNMAAEFGLQPPKKTLKADAVPTIFTHKNKQSTSREASERRSAAFEKIEEMDGTQHFTPTSHNGRQQGEQQVSHDLKGTGTRTHENVRIIGQSKDDIQIREGLNVIIMNNSVPGNIPDVAGKSQEKSVSEKTISTEVKTTEGQLGSKDTAEKPSSSAQIVLPHTAMESNTATNQGAGPATLHTELLSNDANSILQRSVSADGETQLNQAAIKLLQKLEFKNPGRKQIEYGTFNPESSEREKKKLRRFQNSKPRTGACYKEDGILLDGRDLCDCLTESCPGCFYPCPQCGSQKCGPTCRCNRRWVYDYIEDEARTYKVEFPEAENFGT